MLQMRTTKPSNNKYYIRLADGGYNGAIKGNPTDSTANVLSNCVGYANGRFNEIGGYGKCKYQLTCNAENFIERAKSLGLSVSKKPVLGGIMVWQKGASLKSIDGAGHVAIVEKIIDDNTIYTSESAYGGKAFYNAIRTNNNKRWGSGTGFKFRGCIINPALTDQSEIKVGDLVEVTNPIIYDTQKRFYTYYKTYVVMQLSGDRAVIGVNNKVTAPIDIKNLKKVR